MKKLLKVSIIVAVVIVIAYIGVSFHFSNKLLYPPLSTDEELKAEYDITTPEEVGLTYETVSFPSRDKDISISGWYITDPRFDVPDSKRAIVLVHGRSSNKKAMVRYAPFFVSRGYSVLIIDLRGHGESSPAFTTFGDHDRNDVMGAVDWLLENGFGADDTIGFMGLSMGATTAYLGAMDLNDEKEGTVDFIIFDSGIPDVPASIVFNSKKAVGPAVPILLPGALVMARIRSGADFEDGNPMAHTEDLDIPVLFIIHTEDDMIPYEEQLMLYEAYNGSKAKIVFEGLGHHRGHVEMQTYYEYALDEFLTRFGF